MTDAADLLAAIIADPSNDLPRLIYADYLDDRGEHQRAEFIRLQCKLANRSVTDQERGIAADLAKSHTINRKSDGTRALLARESELLHLSVGVSIGQAFPIASNCITLGPVVPNPHRCTGLLRRGFVEEITCSWDDWRQHADAIRAATPLKKVRLTTAPGRNWRMDLLPRERRVIADSLTDRYPDIEFELPQAVTLGGVPVVMVPELEEARRLDWSQMTAR